jgi:hypothetical protein
MMGIYAGPAPFSIDEIYGMYYQYNPKTDQTAWLIGRDRYVGLARMQYTDGRYLIDQRYLVDQAEMFLMGIPIDITDTNRSELKLYERGVPPVTGKTIPLDRCPSCGAPIMAHPILGCPWRSR